MGPPPAKHNITHPQPILDNAIVVKPTTKQWDEADKAFLHQLIVKGRVNIKDLSMENIDSVKKKHFTHHTTSDAISRTLPQLTTSS
jgi:hypothetical protein